MQERVVSRGPGATVGRVVALAADVAALILVVWIALDLLDANQANAVVQWFHDAANWLSGWSRDLFDIDREWVRVVVGYGLPALVYLLVGHALARFLHRV
ncbi:hypothetical protein [Streptomyces sp. NRRL S-87]|uniref:hypothetical protein n=1 Tax=Streptomyces sp. NRRL S-87 TaxID=1463920 RepID=UPI00068B7414|nr:hypothetical protein [Streptomyces sp. NRRL S-87]